MKLPFYWKWQEEQIEEWSQEFHFVLAPFLLWIAEFVFRIILRLNVPWTWRFLVLTNGLPLSKERKNTKCTPWVTIPEATKEVSLQDQGRRRVLFSGRFPSLDIASGYRPSPALKIQHFLQLSWLLPLVIDTGFLPVLSMSTRSPCQKHCLLAPKIIPIFLSWSIAKGIASSWLHSRDPSLGEAWMLGNGWRWFCMRVSFIKNVGFVFCDFSLRRVMVFFERLNLKDPLRSNHKLKVSAKLHLKIQILFFAGI